jgi:hypothetical protein
MTKPDFGCLLRALTEHGVDFLVVGGVGAILQGATLSTFDLDIVHSTEPANIARLLAALADLDACYRAQPDKRLRPSQTHLSSPGHQLLMTRFGPLDVRSGRFCRSSATRSKNRAGSAAPNTKKSPIS